MSENREWGAGWPVRGLLICLLSLVFILTGFPAQAARPETIYAVPAEIMKESKGTTPTLPLSEYKGKVLLIVNVASKCGFTKQYKGLEELHRKYKERGLAVLGFPSNDFGGQEPGTEAEIVKFCQTNFGVTFPVYAKLHAKGENISPLFEWLTGKESPYPGEVRWNFEKFLVSRQGKLMARFPSKSAPDAPELIDAIEKELAK